MSVDGFRYGSSRPIDPDEKPDHGPGCNCGVCDFDLTDDELDALEAQS